MNRLDFYKNLFEREDQRKNEINNSISIPLGIVTTLIGVGFYFTVNFEYEINNTLKILFIASLFIFYSIILYIIYYLVFFTSHWGKGFFYNTISYADELEKYWKETKEFYNSDGETEKCEIETKTTKDFETMLIENYISATSHNTKINDTKSELRFKVNKWTSFNTVWFIVISILFSVNHFLRDDKPQKIEIEKLHDYSDEINKLNKNLNKQTIEFQKLNKSINNINLNQKK